MGSNCATPQSPNCTKCGKNPRADADSNNPWCKDCRAEYQRDWDRGKKERERHRGYVEGAAAMREQIVLALARLGNAQINALDTARWVREQPTPDQ